MVSQGKNAYQAEIDWLAVKFLGEILRRATSIARQVARLLELGQGYHIEGLPVEIRAEAEQSGIHCPPYGRSNHCIDLVMVREHPCEVSALFFAIWSE